MMTEITERKKLDTNSMNQMISEYDQVIHQLQQQISTYKVESESLIQQVKEVTDENNRLNVELQNALAYQVDRQKDGNTVVDQQQTSYISLWKQANEEIKTLKQNDIERIAELEKYKVELALAKKSLDVANVSADRLQAKCTQLGNEKQKCLQTAQKLDKEITELQEQLSQNNIELKEVNIKNENMKTSLMETKRELKRKTTQLESITNQDTSADIRLHSLKTTNAELEARVSALQKEVTLFRETSPNMESQIVMLQEKIVALEKKEQAAIDHVKESVEITEVALAEKQQSEFREQQCLKENKKLKKTIEVILEEAGGRTKVEIDRLKTEYNQNIDKMADEIQSLEKDCSEKQTKLDRVLREKKELEKEIKMISSQGPQEQTWVKNTLSELRSKLFTAERARDEMDSKIKTLELTLSTERMRLVEEQKQMEETLEQLSLERKRNQSEESELRREISSISEQLKASQEKNNLFENELKDTKRKHKKQVAILNEQRTLKERDLVSKAKCAQEAHSKITIDLRELVTAQQAMAIKWREETGSITDRFERTVHDLHEKLNEEKKKSRELLERYNKHKQNNEKLMKKVEKLEQELLQATEELKDSESRAEHATNQMNLLLLREKKMMKEKREAQRQLDHAKLQVARNLSIMDPTLKTNGGIQYSKSYRGAGTMSAATSFNNTSIFPTHQYVFDGLNKGLHSTPRPHLPIHRTHPPSDKHTNDLPLNGDMDNTVDSSVQSS